MEQSISANGQSVSAKKEKRGSVWEVLRVSFMLGITSFGGPVAHLGYFHNEYVHRRQWLDAKSYADLVALCQFLPGPASSQVGIGIGTIRAGWLGGLAAWLGFTMPSIILLVLFALLVNHWELGDAGWIHGLKLVAVAVVAQAVWGMAQKLSAGRTKAAITTGALIAALLWPSAGTQVLVIAGAAAAGLLLLKSAGTEAEAVQLGVAVSRKAAWVCLGVFFALLAGLPVLAAVTSSHSLDLIDSFYRSGSLVFGGGHVVLPLLEQETVAAGWLAHEDFIAGYGAAQAVPGPLFTFASYLGTVSDGIAGAALATAAIFLPAALLVYGTLPFWSALRTSGKAQAALAGVNAAVVGILLAALYDPIWISAVKKPEDMAAVAALFAMLAVWKLPPWAVVAAGAAVGLLLPYI